MNLTRVVNVQKKFVSLFLWKKKNDKLKKRFS